MPKKSGKLTLSLPEDLIQETHLYATRHNTTVRAMLREIVTGLAAKYWAERSSDRDCAPESPRNVLRQSSTEDR